MLNYCEQTNAPLAKKETSRGIPANGMSRGVLTWFGGCSAGFRPGRRKICGTAFDSCGKSRPAVQLFSPGQQNHGDREVGNGGKLHREHHHALDEGIHHAIAQQIAAQQHRAQGADRLPAPALRAFAELIGRHIDAAATAFRPSMEPSPQFPNQPQACQNSRLPAVRAHTI